MLYRAVGTFVVSCICLLGIRGAAGDPPRPAVHYRLTRIVSGWLPYWLNKNGDGAGWKVVDGHVNMLDQVSFFEAQADPATGNLTPNFGATDTALNSEIATLHENDVQALVTVTQFNHVHEIISNPVATAHLIDSIIVLLDRYNLDGVDIDFEDFSHQYPDDASLYTVFIQDLSTRLHHRVDSFELPTTVIATVLARTERGHFSFADETALANTDVDQVRIMAYDDYYSGSKTAGANAPLPWVQSVEQYLRQAQAPTWKFVIGMPGYGYQWPVASATDMTTLAKGNSVTFHKAATLQEQYHVSRQWDAQNAAPYFTYDSADGKHWIAYYEDAQSWKSKIDNVVADVNGPAVGGMAEWAFGDEDPSSWPEVHNSLGTRSSIYSAIGLCYTHFGGGARFGDPLEPEQSCGQVSATAWNGRSGREQRFSAATFFYQWNSPRAYFVQGDILRQYAAEGGPTGALGFPISDQFDNADGYWTQKFEHGTLTVKTVRESAISMKPDRVLAASINMTGCALIGAGFYFGSRAKSRAKVA